MNAKIHQTARLTTATRWFRNRLVPGGLICLLFVLGVQAQQGSTPSNVKAAKAAPAKSKPGNNLVVVQFENSSTDVADGFWIDFDGKARHYFTLPSGQKANLQTYTGHVWHWYVNDVLAQTFVAGEEKEQTVKITAKPPTGPLRLLLPTELMTKGPYQPYDSVLVTQTSHGISKRTFVGKAGKLPINSLMLTPVIEVTCHIDGPQQATEMKRVEDELKKLYAESSDYAPEIKQDVDALDRPRIRVTFPSLEFVELSNQNPPVEVGVWKGKTVENPPLEEIPAVPGGVATPCLEIPWLPPEMEKTLSGSFYTHLTVLQTAFIGAEELSYESELDLVRKGQHIESPQRRLTFIRIDPSLLTWNQSSPQYSPLTKTSLELSQGDRSLSHDFEPYKRPDGGWTTPPAICWPVLRPNFDQDPPVIANIQFIKGDQAPREWPESGKNLFRVVGPELQLELVDFDWIFDPPVVTY